MRRLFLERWRRFSRSLKETGNTVSCGDCTLYWKIRFYRNERYQDLDKRSRADLAMPDFRRGRLRRELKLKGFVNAMEAHDGLTGLIVENTKVYKEGAAHQFDARCVLWSVSAYRW